ncbi:DUF4238 domain-containing protein [Vibrio harveyi]|uniref:DUF4238 domain-containing protein n=1 Tax=Vibrio TaxID=662 RepID=UPI0022CD5E39|nr:DUF4238 domain-containing protein [Vibrio sp. NFR]ELP3501644.1 DUF4238 domain-containing protein [Vibrio vulnificus]ELP3550442.1 DUF4238 domain-containing protein [Vibrio vulnificus]ELP7003293.1 DUF4238 domain-containing protein [Vibrio vulnificus]MDA0135852.1 DUF4238 domain-containing protein [Vibrio sp. NFR]
MKYTKNQHMLSQWVLRNFRSDDTAEHPKDKQRVWCHTVYHSPEKENDIKEIPLPISSIAIHKDCFMLIDHETGKKFDIEDELSDYENSTSVLFNELIHKHKFTKLLDVTRKGHALEMLLNFMVIQMVLGFYNPQNKMDDKDEVLLHILSDMEENYENIEKLIFNPPKEVKPYCSTALFKKIERVAKSKSEVKDKCNALFILSMLSEAKGLPSLFGYLSSVRNNMFKNIYITGIYHTGYDFDSTEIRPVFTISPNVFILNPDNNLNLLPLAHNLALSFSVGESEYYNSHLKVYSVDPSKLKCRTSKRIHTYKVSHDFIDNITGWITAIGVSHTKTLYTPYELKDIERYLVHQSENEEYHYSPQHPQFVVI